MKSSDNQTQSQDTAAAAAPARLVSPTRRRLLRGGVVGVPAMLALKSTPVMATSANCKLPSGFSTSGNASHNQGAGCAPPCSKPSWWKNQYNSSGCYTGSNCYQTEKFSKYFNRGSYSDRTLHNCLNGGDTEDRAMAMACYLQACSDGGSRFPTTTMIKNVWDLGVIGGSYTVPGSNAVWDKTRSIAYLKYLTGQQPPV